jgi:hypothetical protein
MSGSPTNILDQADSAFQIIDYFPTFASSVFFHNLIRTILVVFNNQY